MVLLSSWRVFVYDQVLLSQVKSQEARICCTLQALELTIDGTVSFPRKYSKLSEEAMWDTESNNGLWLG